jgi:CubicO group peptidase (beta-lactamase class C family)
VLGAVLQSAAGKPFPDVIAELVSKPLGMAHTTVEQSGTPTGERARLYSRTTDGELVDAPTADLTDRLPSGGFVSTADDLARFAQGLLDTSFLRAEAREVLFASQRTADGKETGVGLGWRIARDSRGRPFVNHGGDTVGGRAFVLLYPEQRVAVALVTNLTFAPFGEKEALSLAEPYLSR